MAMAVEIVADSPLAKALQNVVHPKLIEMGWSGELQDDTLSEYIILMLANGKSQEQIAVELATDLLDLPSDDQSTKDFARWLFEQVAILSAPENGGQSTIDVNDAEVSPSTVQDDADMGDAPSGPAGSVPTAPKSMRNGTQQKSRDRRMMGQVNKALTSSNDDPLRKVRGTSGTGRINSHASRDPPRGPRNQQLQRNLTAAANRGINGSAPSIPGMMPQVPQLQPGQTMNAQDQMQFMATLAETAQMMAWQMQQMGGMAGMGPQGGQNGKSMFDRVDKHQGRRHHNGPRHHNQTQGDANMGENGASGDMEMGEISGHRDQSKVLCRFDTTCGKADCQFAHHSPASRPGMHLPEINMDSECSFGVACKNPICSDRHVSRAQKMAHQADIECTYGLFCTKPNCPFKHPPPNMKPCRNGADCTTEGCPFWHSKIECKHNPCKNAMCPYKHKPGQKTMGFGDNVWTPEKAQAQAEAHISERKFVDSNAGPEELITGGQSQQEAAPVTVMEAEMIS